MAIELIDKVKPKNGGAFAMVDAADVEFSDGTRLPEKMAEVGGGAAIETATDEDIIALFSEPAE